MKFPRRKRSRKPPDLPASVLPASEVIPEAATAGAVPAVPRPSRPRDPRTGRYVKRTAA